MRLPWRLPLALWRLLRAVLHLCYGIAVMGLRFPSFDATQRHAAIQQWSAGLLRALGLTLRVHGQPRPGSSLLVANHVSWLDIAAVHAACPQARFVSKADVLRWPVLGWLIRGAGTLFIERERKRDALRVVHEIAAALQRGETVAVFPEGTTGAGDRVLPLHANLLQAAIAVEAPIQLAVLHYTEPGQAFAWSAQYIGDTTLLQSVWRVVNARGLSVDLRFQLSQSSAHADRRLLANKLQQDLQQALDDSAG